MAQNGNYNFLALLFFNLSSIWVTGLIPPSFEGAGWEGEGRKTGRKKLVSGEKTRQRKCWGAWHYVHQLQCGMKVKFSATLIVYLPMLLISTFLVQVWPSRVLEIIQIPAFDRIFKQAVLMLKDPNASIDTICTNCHTRTHTHTHTPTSYMDERKVKLLSTDEPGGICKECFIMHLPCWRNANEFK